MRLTRPLQLAGAAAALVAARAWLWLAPGSAVRWSSSRSQPSARRASRVSDIDGIARAVAGVGARVPVSATCLEQGVALVLLLASVRIPAHLVVGVGLHDSASALRAHAWVQCDGRVVLGASQAHGLSPLPFPSPCRG